MNPYREGKLTPDPQPRWFGIIIDKVVSFFEYLIFDTPVWGRQIIFWSILVIGCFIGAATSGNLEQVLIFLSFVGWTLLGLIAFLTFLIGVYLVWFWAIGASPFNRKN